MNAPRVFALVLAAACLLPVAGQAQTSLGIGAGIARPHNSNSQLWLTAGVRFPVGRRLALEPEAAYWPGRASPREVPIEFKDVYVGGSALLRFPSARVTVFAGGGGGIHRFDVASQGTRLGFHAVAGLDVKVGGAVSLFGAARRDWTRFEPDDLWVTRVYGGLRLAP